MLCGELVEQDFDFIEVLIEAIYVYLKARSREMELLTGRAPRTQRIIR